MGKKVTLEKAINIVCQYCVKCCCDDDCPIHETEAHYEGTDFYTKDFNPDLY